MQSGHDGVVSKTFFRSFADDIVSSEEELENGIADQEVDTEVGIADVVEVDDSSVENDASNIEE